MQAPDISCENLCKVFGVLLLHFEGYEVGHLGESVDNYP